MHAGTVVFTAGRGKPGLCPSRTTTVVPHPGAEACPPTRSPRHPVCLPRHRGRAGDRATSRPSSTASTSSSSVHAQRPGARPRGPRPRQPRPRGRAGRARRDGLPGGQADRHARRRPRGPGVRPARPARRARRGARATSAGSGCATTAATPCSIDWRAPAAAVFYQATAADPQGVVRRRVLRCAGPKVVGGRGRPARRRGRDRPADRRRGRADGAAVPGPRPVHALDRGDHPGRAGPGDPGARARAWC